MPDPYVLSGTAILRNRFNLTTHRTWMKPRLTLLRLRELARNFIKGDYGVRHYLPFHRYKFQNFHDIMNSQHKYCFEIIDMIYFMRYKCDQGDKYRGY